MATFTTTTPTAFTSLSGVTAITLTHPPSSPSVSVASTKAVTLITENAFSIERRPGYGSPMGLHGTGRIPRGHSCRERQRFRTRAWTGSGTPPTTSCPTIRVSRRSKPGSSLDSRQREPRRQGVVMLSAAATRGPAGQGSQLLATVSPLTMASNQRPVARYASPTPVPGAARPGGRAGRWPGSIAGPCRRRRG